MAFYHSKKNRKKGLHLSLKSALKTSTYHPCTLQTLKKNVQTCGHLGQEIVAVAIMILCQKVLHNLYQAFNFNFQRLPLQGIRQFYNLITSCSSYFFFQLELYSKTLLSANPHINSDKYCPYSKIIKIFKLFSYSCFCCLIAEFVIADVKSKTV